MAVKEMKKFLGLTFITGIIKKSKLKCIGQIILFLAHQYFHNNAFLHSSDSSLHQAHACDMLSHKFFQMYAPLQHLAVDKWVSAWRGLLLYQVCNPGKKVECGIMVWTLHTDLMEQERNTFCISPSKTYKDTHMKMQCAWKTKNTVKLDGFVKCVGVSLHPSM
jgi:hypothetical protein